jgi:hypothetical protein
MVDLVPPELLLSMVAGRAQYEEMNDMMVCPQEQYLTMASGL